MVARRATQDWLSERRVERRDDTYAKLSQLRDIVIGRDVARGSPFQTSSFSIHPLLSREYSIEHVRTQSERDAAAIAVLPHGSGVYVSLLLGWERACPFDQA